MPTILWSARHRCVRFALGSVAIASLLAAYSGLAVAAQDDEMAIPVRGFLCDTAAHAVLFADMRAKGETEEIAKDRVGRVAGGEVCGFYTGAAIVQSEQVSLRGGIAYRVTAFRFSSDQRIAWLAERSFAPTHTQWTL